MGAATAAATKRGRTLSWAWAATGRTGGFSTTRLGRRQPAGTRKKRLVWSDSRNPEFGCAHDYRGRHAGSGIDVRQTPEGAARLFATVVDGPGRSRHSQAVPGRRSVGLRQPAGDQRKLTARVFQERHAELFPAQPTGSPYAASHLAHPALPFLGLPVVRLARGCQKSAGAESGLGISRVQGLTKRTSRRWGADHRPLRDGQQDGAPLGPDPLGLRRHLQLPGQHPICCGRREYQTWVQSRFLVSVERRGNRTLGVVRDAPRPLRDHPRCPSVPGTRRKWQAVPTCPVVAGLPVRLLLGMGRAAQAGSSHSLPQLWQPMDPQAADNSQLDGVHSEHERQGQQPSSS